MGFYIQFEDASHIKFEILLKILKMANTITHFAFLAVLIFRTYSAPAEPSEDNVFQCYNGTYTTKENSTRSEILSNVKLIPCNEGTCYGRKIQENFTLGCTTQRPDIENGKCKEDIKGKNNVTIDKECHCHNDSESILLLMGVPEEKPEDKPEEKPEEKPEDKPEDKPEEKPKDKPEGEDKPEDKSTCNNEQHERHYDGLSFFGGILLTVSVSLIGYFVYRKRHPRGIESQRLWN